MQKDGVFVDPELKEDRFDFGGVDVGDVEKAAQEGRSPKGTKVPSESAEVMLSEFTEKQQVPPRPGLVFDRQKHRWVKPEEAKIISEKLPDKFQSWFRSAFSDLGNDYVEAKLKVVEELPRSTLGKYDPTGKRHYCESNVRKFAKENDEDVMTGYLVEVGPPGEMSFTRHCWNAKDGKVIEHTPLDIKWDNKSVQYRGVLVPRKEALKNYDWVNKFDDRVNRKIKQYKGVSKSSLTLKDSIYDWVDNKLEEGGFHFENISKQLIEGKPPRGAKSLGSEIEANLYDSLSTRVKGYLDTVSPNADQTEVLNGVMDTVSSWQEEVSKTLSEQTDNLYMRGFVAGSVDAGVKPAMNLADRAALEFIKANPNRIGSRIKIFAEDLIGEFRTVIANSYSPEGTFNLDTLTKEMMESVDDDRYRIERVIRTETASVSNSGRLAAWEKDEDRLFYNYLWNSAMDNRTKPISLWRYRNGPYSFEEIKHLWENQEQKIGDHWFADQYNQRCSISRSPIDSENTGNRFKGLEADFRRTS